MAKAKTTGFFCKECGYETSKWLGQCPGCKAWNTLVEAPLVKAQAKRGLGAVHAGVGLPAMDAGVPKKLSEIRSHSEERTSTGMEELDRVLGGGLVGGSLI